MIRKLSFAAPFLVAIFSVVSLYAANAARLDPISILLPAVLGLVIAGLFLLLFWLLKWTSPAAPFIASVWTGVFLYWYIAPWPLDLFILAGATFVGIGSKRFTTPAAVLVCGITIIGSLITGIQAGVIDAGKVEAAPTSAGPFLYKPGQSNIYFIVPDRMPSPAAMREIGITPEPILDRFRKIGFYINEDQVSADPYTVDWPNPVYTTRTMRYFASVLNGGAPIPMDIKYQDCRTMIRDNAAFTWLHGKGYSIVNIPSWFTETKDFTDQDQAFPFQDVNLMEKFFNDELGEAYFSRTLLNGLNFRALESFGSQRRTETARLKWQAARILDVANAGPSSTFVIAHLMLPHEPFIFANPADPVPVQYNANIRTALLYLDELAGAIRSADPTATIIIQSDEGMAFHKPADLNRSLTKVQWSGVFNAWFLPNSTISLEEITHTNILGVVVNSK